MSNMKCPICRTPLDSSFVVDKVYGCPKCRSIGTIDLWKSLDIAVKELRASDRYYKDDDCIKQALNKIKAQFRKEQQ